jgi:hypothetical protein
MAELSDACCTAAAQDTCSEPSQKERLLRRNPRRRLRVLGRRVLGSVLGGERRPLA